ncbi:MAG: Hsp20/alpha crystallin family protein [Planctomycetes bacterium]|nr:Hsp20/alpha crystallin family protein [Planctomycetota bacterium]
MQPTLWKSRDPLTLWNGDLEPLFDEFFKTRGQKLPELFRRAPLPVVNLADSPNEFSASIELPGMEEKDIEVQIVGGQLVISGERKWEEEKQDKRYYAVESQYGAFQRALTLPEGLNLDPDAVVAKLQKGVLEIRIPKLEPKAPSKVKVTSK